MAEKTCPRCGRAENTGKATKGEEFSKGIEPFAAKDAPTIRGARALKRAYERLTVSGLFTAGEAAAVKIHPFKFRLRIEVLRCSCVRQDRPTV